MVGVVISCRRWGSYYFQANSAKPPPFVLALIINEIRNFLSITTVQGLWFSGIILVSSYPTT